MQLFSPETEDEETRNDSRHEMDIFHMKDFYCFLNLF